MLLQALSLSTSGSVSMLPLLCQQLLFVFKSYRLGCNFNSPIFLKTPNKINNDKMINGLSLSQIQQVNLSQINHYRRISQIENGNFSRFSRLDPELIKVVNNRRFNHEKWKRFNQSKFSTQLEKGNESYRIKLEKIKLGKSIYTSDNRNLPMHSKPSNFYNRKRYQELIDANNPGIARKIINVKGSFDRSKTDIEYSRYRDTVHRLERFSVIQRMTTFSQRRSKIKTQESKNSRLISSFSPSLDKKGSGLQTPKKFLTKI